MPKEKPRPYGSPARDQPVTVIPNQPASSVSGALSNAKKQVEKAK